MGCSSNNALQESRNNKNAQNPQPQKNLESQQQTKTQPQQLKSQQQPQQSNNSQNPQPQSQQLKSQPQQNNLAQNPSHDPVPFNYFSNEQEAFELTPENIKYEIENARKIELEKINQYRKIHNAEPLKLNTKITEIAQKSAEESVEKEYLCRSTDNTFEGKLLGELYSFEFKASGIKYKVGELTKSFYESDIIYDYNSYSNTYYEKKGISFAQIVWKSTKEVGIGFGIKGNKYIFIIINFFPKGNSPGELESNVELIRKPKPKPEPKPIIPPPINQPDISLLKKPKKPDFTPEELERIRQEELKVINEFRKEHHVEPLKLNSEINELAQDWAKSLAKRGKLDHSDNKYKHDILGENLFCTFAGLLQTYWYGTASKFWYREVDKYDFNYPDNSCGHFTQLVWKRTKEIGLGFVCNGDDVYVVAEFYPPGNCVGEYTDNVLPK